MPDTPTPPISRRTLNNLISYRTSLLSAIGHLRGIEENTARPRVRRPPTATHDTDTQVCEGCHRSGHHYTECLNHQYVWDSSANARLLQPGERLSGPADWHDIHRASLHHLIRTSIQYYIRLHHTRIQDIHQLLEELETNSQFGDISRYAQHGREGLDTEPSPVARVRDENDLYPPLSAGPPSEFLINLAVLTATTRLRVDPWCDNTGYIQFIALNHWHPSFGIEFPAFLRLVYTELREHQAHQDRG
jgi:hypothetical protein